ncbi:MAG: hypothetical protein ABIW79_05365, partial [Gemmatimonas sp.]
MTQRPPYSIRQRRGVALLVVLWTIMLLASVAAIASSAARGSADIASARRAGVIARAMAESGIALATARIDDVLRGAADSSRKDAFLDALDHDAVQGVALAADTLGDGVFAVTAVDVSARLDVNSAGPDGWYLFLRQFTSEVEARAVTARIDERVRGTTSRRADRAADAERMSRDSLVAALLGRDVSPSSRRRFETLDDLLDIPGIDVGLLERVSPMLTVDGNGTLNRRAATPEVLAAASGSLV